MADHEGSDSTDIWDAVAESYGSSPVFARLGHALVDLMDISTGDSILDLGTGTGPALIPAALRNGSGPVVGVDRSSGMLAVAAARSAEAGLTNVVLVRADAARLPLPDAGFHVVLAASLWQFLGYSGGVLAEWRRVLRPGGHLGFSVPRPGSGLSIPPDLMAKYFPMLPPSHQEHLLSRGPDRPMPDLSEAAVEAGFSEAKVVNRSLDHIIPGPDDWWAIQWTHGIRRFLQGLDAEPLAMLKGEALARLKRLDTGEIIVTTRTLYCVCRR